MRILQVNSFAPTNQNKTTFESSNLTLLRRKDKAYELLCQEGCSPKVVKEYKQILGKAAARLFAGSNDVLDVMTLQTAKDVLMASMLRPGIGSKPACKAIWTDATLRMKRPNLPHVKIYWPNERKVFMSREESMLYI